LATAAPLRLELCELFEREWAATMIRLRLADL
jgi:hypothetical protein